MKILVATRDAQLLLRLHQALPARHELEAVSPEAVLARIADCELLVIDDSDGDAAALSASVRAANRVLPILAVTQPGDLEARVRALEAGADDSLAEPWAGSQMAARVGALGRRGALVPDDDTRVEADGCVLLLEAGRAERTGRAVSLSAREVELVRWLMRHAGRAVSREELLEQVWQVSPDIETRSVDVAVAALRKKIERDPSTPSLIVSVRGLGYAWGPGLT